MNNVMQWFLFIHSIIHSFIHSFRLFYSASSSPLLLRGAPDTARIMYFTPKGHRQLRVKDLPKVHTWWLERDSNRRPFGRKGPNLPMSIVQSWPLTSAISLYSSHENILVSCWSL